MKSLHRGTINIIVPINAPIIIAREIAKPENIIPIQKPVAPRSSAKLDNRGDSL